jgi:hypothetical protein
MSEGFKGGRYVCEDLLHNISQISKDLNFLATVIFNDFIYF